MTTDNPGLMAALEPCPFCGGEELSHGYEMAGIYFAGHVECHTCNACITADGEDEAIAGWNRRASPSPTVGQEALKTAIDHIEHMAAWITRTNKFRNTASYSFESLGEDMPAIKAALAPSVAEGSAKIEAYNQMREIAEGLGYPSILEALEAAPPATDARIEPDGTTLRRAQIIVGIANKAEGASPLETRAVPVDVLRAAAMIVNGVAFAPLLDRMNSPQPAPAGDARWPLRARVWTRGNEKVLEIEGTINDTNMTCRHTQPLSVKDEDVPGLPSLYATPVSGDAALRKALASALRALDSDSLPIVRRAARIQIKHALTALSTEAGNGEMRPSPRLLSDDEAKVLLASAEQLWADLQSDNLGGFSGINRPFYITHEFKRVIEQFGGRDVGLHWSKDQLDATIAEAGKPVEDSDWRDDMLGAAYQIIGALADRAGVFEEPSIIAVLDAFAEPGPGKDDLLPLRLPASSVEAGPCNHQADRPFGDDVDPASRELIDAEGKP